MLDGVMFLWFLLTAASVVFVAIDILRTPESVVLKWGFVLLTVYTGPLGAFLYVLGCREPLPGLHERYVAIRWRQVLGSTMHCVAGDGVGILVGAALAGFLMLPGALNIALEYALGFGFGWTIFQALFMRDTAGGSYRRALAGTFIPELVSMNFLMAGMMPVMAAARMAVPAGENPLAPEFWFIMSMALLAGFILAYPINWWLVAKGLKHGMMTVRPTADAGAAVHAAVGHAPPMAEKAPAAGRGAGGHGAGESPTASAAEIAWVTVLSVAVFALGIAIAGSFGHAM